MLLTAFTMTDPTDHAGSSSLTDTPLHTTMSDFAALRGWPAALAVQSQLAYQTAGHLCQAQGIERAGEGCWQRTYSAHKHSPGVAPKKSLCGVKERHASQLCVAGLLQCLNRNSTCSPASWVTTAGLHILLPWHVKLLQVQGMTNLQYCYNADQTSARKNRSDREGPSELNIPSAVWPNCCGSCKASWQTAAAPSAV
jgi:hypothetical protein